MANVKDLKKTPNMQNQISIQTLSTLPQLLHNWRLMAFSLSRDFNLLQLCVLFFFFFNIKMYMAFSEGNQLFTSCWC